MKHNDLDTVVSTKVEVGRKSGQYFKDSKGEVFEMVETVKLELTWGGVRPSTSVGFIKAELKELPADAVILEN